MLVLAACTSGVEDAPVEGNARHDGERTPLSLTRPSDGALVQSPFRIVGTGSPGAELRVKLEAGDELLVSGGVELDEQGAFAFDRYYPDRNPGEAMTLTLEQRVGGEVHGSVRVALTQASLPETPTITAPLTDDQIESPVQVQGSALAGADVVVELRMGRTVLASAEGQADDRGDYAVTLEFVDQLPGSQFAIAVSQRNEFGSSAVSTIPVRQASPPGAPEITAPVEGDAVSDAVDVVGTAEPGWEVKVEVRTGSFVRGESTVMPDSDGSFSTQVEYITPVNEAIMRVVATQANEYGVSDPAEVQVVNHTRFLAGGVVNQGFGATDGSRAGTRVFVWLYDSAEAGALATPVDEIVIDVTEGQGVSSEPYRFRVTDGTYYVRAFRDSYGPSQTAPDNLPTLGLDAQAAAVEIVIDDGNSTTNHLTLREPAREDRFGRIDAYSVTASESLDGDPEPCDVDHLKLVAGVAAGGANLGSPMLRGPDHSVQTLSDDGACSTPDASSSSFDSTAGDGMFALGIPEPSAEHAGTYTFFYRQAFDDFMHAEQFVVDEQTLQLAPQVRVASPEDGAVAPASPELRWEDYAVTAESEAPGTFAYLLHYSASDNPFENLIALPSETTWLDFADFPAAREGFDLGFYAHCVDSGGTYSNDAVSGVQCAGGVEQPSVTSLEGASSWSWGVQVVECDFADYDPATADDAFTACVYNALTDEQAYARSASSTLYVE